MRLFYGVELPQNVREEAQAVAETARETIPGRYGDPSNYHVTLAFLGEVPQERLEEAADVLRACVRNHPAPKLSLGEVDHFGRAQNGILILRVDAEPDLSALHEAMIRALAEKELPHDSGPFSPHITLARHANTEGAGKIDVRRVSFAAEEACVFLSARDAENVLRYTPIFRTDFRRNP